MLSGRCSTRQSTLAAAQHTPADAVTRPSTHNGQQLARRGAAAATPSSLSTAVAAVTASPAPSTQQLAPTAAVGMCQPHHHRQRPRVVAAAGGGGAAGGVDLSALGLEIPDIDASDIATYQQELGAEFDADGVALNFANTSKVLEALSDGVVVVDRSHWGRLRIAGRDRLDLLHNQSTAAFKELQPGQGCDTVFVTATARCLDLATALVLDSSVMLLVSPSTKQQLMKRLDGVIFPADDVTLTDVSDKCRMLTVMGPQADDVLKQLAGDAFQLAGEPYCRHQLLRFGDGAPVILAVGSGLALPGYTLIVDERGAADLYAALVNKGCVPMGEADWERLRIVQGRPAPGAELTDAYNPLEAGLCHAVSLNKGCYIGQETLAKVTNTNGIKQQLWGLKMTAGAAPGGAVTSEDGSETIGVITSYANLEKEGHFGLAYLKCRRQGVQVPLKDLFVSVDGQPARVVDVPYLTRQLPKTGSSSDDDDGAAAAAAGGDAASLQDRAAAAKAAKEAEKAAQAAAKAARLEAMQKRLEAFQAQQKQQQQK